MGPERRRTTTPAKDTAGSTLEPAPKRGRHVVGERGVTRPFRRMHDRLRVGALPAPSLPQRPDQHRRPAGLAPVEVSYPVMRRLAVGAHQHLLVLDHAALPRTRAFARVD